MSGADIEETWSQHSWNIGLRTGDPSGFWALDVDPKNGGLDSARQLAASHGSLPKTTVTLTGSGGFHYWFLMPGDGIDITNSPGALSKYPGIDVRGNGGLIVVPPSVNASGEYRFRLKELPVAPPRWLVELVRTRPAAQPESSAPEIIDPTERDRLARYTEGAVEAIQAELRYVGGLPPGARDAKNRGWEKCIADAAQRLGQLARASWCPLTLDAAREALLAAAPADDDWTVTDTHTKWKQQATRGPEAPLPPVNRDDPLGPGYRRPASLVAGPPEAPAVTPPVEPEREPLDVGNPAVMADWLKVNLGKGRLSGIYLRSDMLVHVPIRSDAAYRETSKNEDDDDGPAQVRLMGMRELRAKIHYAFRTYTLAQNSKGETRTKHTLFPKDAVEIALGAPHEMSNVPILRGVAHSPVVRPDGTILNQPGYDFSTRLLHIPDPQLVIPHIPHEPTSGDVERAIRGLRYMLQDFPFVSAEDFTNFLGMLMTPLLRNVAPPPYKLAIIDAPQPGSGKTLLANILRTLHGGVFRSELPRDETEFGKVITSILDTTTAPVVVFDNVSGTIKSGTFAGVLTSGRLEDRKLGFSGMISLRNDRLWVATGNNVVIGGDIGRRAIRMTIDRGVPQSEENMRYAIPDFEGWLHRYRGQVLWALLTLIRHWFAQGSPEGPKRAIDNYSRWASLIEAILHHSGITTARFDDPRHRIATDDAEQREWATFLSAIYDVKGDEPWMARDILALIDETSPNVVLAPGFSLKPIPYEALPSDLSAKRRGNQPLSDLTKSLGRWLRNRQGRWHRLDSRQLAVREVPARNASKVGTIWQIKLHLDR